MSWERDLLIKQEQMKDLLRQREEERLLVDRDKRPPRPKPLQQQLLGALLPRLQSFMQRGEGRRTPPCPGEREFV